MSEPYQPSKETLEYLALIARSDALDEAGQGHSPEMDEVYNRLDPAWYAMSAEDREYVRRELESRT